MKSSRDRRNPVDNLLISLLPFFRSTSSAFVHHNNVNKPIGRAYLVLIHWVKRH
jgi:hypothetical protein